MADESSGRSGRRAAKEKWKSEVGSRSTQVRQELETDKEREGEGKEAQRDEKAKPTPDNDES
jgi:hypothetical protein